MLGEASSKVEAALRPERDVDQNDVGAQRLGASQRFGCCRGNSDDALTLSSEERSGSFEERRVVIHDEDAKRHYTRVASANG